MIIFQAMLVQGQFPSGAPSSKTPTWAAVSASNELIEEPENDEHRNSGKGLGQFLFSSSGGLKVQRCEQADRATQQNLYYLTATETTNARVNAASLLFLVHGSRKCNTASMHTGSHITAIMIKTTTTRKQLDGGRERLSGLRPQDPRGPWCRHERLSNHAPVEPFL